jgi:hypothetical protein
MPYPYGSNQGDIPQQGSGFYPTPEGGQDPYGQYYQAPGQGQWNHYPEWTYEDYNNAGSAPVYTQAVPGYNLPMNAQYHQFDPSTMTQQTMPGYSMASGPMAYNPGMNPQQGGHWAQNLQASQPQAPNQMPTPVPQRMPQSSSRYSS